MAKLGIDLSKFKKIAADKDSATLRHADGHEIKIALAALHPSSRGDLARLPLHQEDSDKMAHGVMAEKDQSNPKLEESKKQPPAAKYAQYYDGTPKAPVQQVDAEMPAAAPTPESVDQSAQQIATDSYAGSPVGNGGPLQPQVPAGDVLPLSQPTAEDSAEDEEEKPAESKASEADKSPGDTLQGIAGERVKAAEAEAQAISGQRQAEATHFQDASHIQNGLVNASQQAIKNSTDEADALIKEIKSTKIDPNNLMNSRDFWGKTATIIGLAMGGLGAGAQGKDNPVLNLVNQQIERDVEAQRANLNNKFSLLGAYTQKFKNQMEANAQTQVSIRSKLASDLGEAAATAGTPMAQANLLKQKADIEMSMLPYKMTMAASSVMSGMGPDNSPEKTNALTNFINQTRMVNPDLAKDMESKRVGNEFASHPLSDDTRNQLFARTNMVEAADKLSDWIAKHRNIKGEIDPRVRAEGEALAQELQNQYTKGVGASTSKEEQDTIQKHIIDSDPLKLLGGWNVQPKLKGLIHAQESSLNLLRQQHGLKPLPAIKLATESPAAAATAKQVPLRPGYELYVHNGIPGQRPIKKQ